MLTDIIAERIKMLQMGRMEEKDETDLLGSGRSSGTGNLGRFCGGKQNSGAEKTTRDEPDYDKLMRWRLSVLKEHGLGLKEIQETIASIDPLPGAKEFLDELRSFAQVIIISDTFTEFAQPLMKKLGWPTNFLQFPRGSRGRRDHGL